MVTEITGVLENMLYEEMLKAFFLLNLHSRTQWESNHSLPILKSS